MKNSNGLLIWTEKTAFLHLGTGIEFLNVTVPDNTIDMTGSKNLLYVLTLKGLFKFRRTTLELLATINCTFNSNSKMQFFSQINRIVVSKGKKLMFYFMEPPVPLVEPV